MANKSNNHVHHAVRASIVWALTISAELQVLLFWLAANLNSGFCNNSFGTIVLLIAPVIAFTQYIDICNELGNVNKHTCIIRAF